MSQVCCDFELKIKLILKGVKHSRTIYLAYTQPSRLDITVTKCAKQSRPILSFDLYDLENGSRSLLSQQGNN